MFFEEDNNECRVNFSITMHGQTHEFNGEFDDCVTWPEILDKIVKTLEAVYGYSFDLDVETSEGLMGIYYKGKGEDDVGN